MRKYFAVSIGLVAMLLSSGAAYAGTLNGGMMWSSGWSMETMSCQYYGTDLQHSTAITFDDWGQSIFDPSSYSWGEATGDFGLGFSSHSHPNVGVSAGQRALFDQQSVPASGTTVARNGAFEIYNGLTYLQFVCSTVSRQDTADGGLILSFAGTIGGQISPDPDASPLDPNAPIAYYDPTPATVTVALADGLHFPSDSATPGGLFTYLGVTLTTDAAPVPSPAILPASLSVAVVLTGANLLRRRRLAREAKGGWHGLG